jgi:hypothetical protein
MDEDKGNLIVGKLVQNMTRLPWNFEGWFNNIFHLTKE